MDTLSAWSLAPPLAAIGLAMVSRRIHWSLLTGIWLGAMLQARGHLLAGTVGAAGQIARVVMDPSHARLLLFALLIGPLILGLERFGGVAGFVGWAERRRLVKSPRGARMLAWLVGVVVFIESNITLLVTGAVCRPLFDRHGESREKLAYLADSTSAPVCILIPFNAWGALVLGLLGSQEVPHPLGTFLRAIPLNFYALAAVVLAGWTAWTGWSLGPMRGRSGKGPPGAPGARVAPAPAGNGRGGEPRAINLVLPLTALMVGMPVALLVTGAGVLSRGSGSASALWAVLGGNVTLWLLVLGQRLATLREVAGVVGAGMRSFLGLVLILLLAVTLGETCHQLGTGLYMAGWLQGLARPVLLLPLTFATAAAVAFATGTSWGTFAIMVPIAIPAAAGLALEPAPFLAAALSGGIFGDHASPLSDTTIVASMAAGTSVVNHVRTQLPYALLAAGGALAAFGLTGALL